MGRESHKEEELIHLSQKMMEDNEFRLKAMKEASENELRDIKEYYVAKTVETEAEFEDVSCLSRISSMFDSYSILD